jgi:hypothetical protein
MKKATPVMATQNYIAPIILLPPNQESKTNYERKKHVMMNNLLKKNALEHGFDSSYTRTYLFSRGQFCPRGPLPGEGAAEDRVNADRGVDRGVDRDDMNIDIVPRDIQEVDNRPLHQQWLSKLVGIEGSRDPMAKFWATIEAANNRRVDMTPGDLKDIATSICELYDVMYQRMGDIIIGKYFDPIKVIYNFISRGYHAYEAILESPDLGVFFMDNERISMPAFVNNLFKDL